MRPASPSDDIISTAQPVATPIANGAKPGSQEQLGNGNEAVRQSSELELAVISAGPQVGRSNPAATTPRRKLRTGAVITALYATVLVSALNTTIVATAIPTISASLHSSSGYAWIGGAYLLANAASGTIFAKLSDIWGRKLILLGIVGLFFCSSILCALSTSMRMLIAGRALQGAAGGGIFQLVNITISDLFSQRDRSFYLGFLSIIWAFAGAIGPVLGGLFTQFLSWRFIFWIILPIAGIAFVLLLLFLDVHNPRTPCMVGMKAMDWFGTISILGLMVMLLLGLDFGGTVFPWNSPTVVGLIVAGCCMTGFFLWSENSLAKYPLVSLMIFQSKSNAACLLISFFHDFIWIASGYYLPLYFQSALLCTPLRSGTLLLPVVLTESLTGLAGGIYVNHTGRYRPLIYIGPVVLLIGDAFYTTFSATSTLPRIISVQIVAGLGTGLLFLAPLLALQVNVPHALTSSATSTMGLTRSLATCLSVVIGGVIFQSGMEGRAQDLRATGLSEALVEKLTVNAAANVGLIREIGDAAQRLVVQEAFANSWRGIWYLCVGMAGFAVLASACVREKELSSHHVETETGVPVDVKVSQAVTG